MSGLSSIKMAVPVVLLAILSVAVPAAFAASGEPQAATSAPAAGRQPVEITAERLTADNRAHTAVFEGSVVARQGEVTLYADWMKVFYSGSGDVREIRARGNVKLTKGGREITSEEAVYYRDEQKVVFSGNPVAAEGNGTISGSRMVYYLVDDRSVVEDSRVIIKGGDGP